MAAKRFFRKLLKGLRSVPRVIVTDKQGYQKLGRALVTVTFVDAAVKKASLERGMEVEIRGVVDTMQAGAITIRDAHLLNK